MTILLDENFPLRLYRRLRQRGYAAEDIIVLGQRGVPDSAIGGRLRTEELLFLTNDTDFIALAAGCRATILLSRVSQNLPVEDRVRIWLAAIDEFLAHPPAVACSRSAMTEC